MNLSTPLKPVEIVPTRPLYKWAKTFNQLQRNFFVDDVKLRREKQIEDFIKLNGYNKVKFKIDTDVFGDLSVIRCEQSSDAELVVITDQKFSRYPCQFIIEQIRYYMSQCPALYLCLNRHYINLDNSFHDLTLDSNFPLAITQWLKKNLPELDIVDLSLDYVDYGQNFTWAIPDRHYYIRKLNAKKDN